MWLSSFSVAPLAWRWAFASPRCGSRRFRNGQRKQIIRTHHRLEIGSDYIGLVRKMGLEPTRHGHTHLKRACLPIPALPQITGRTSVANGILAQMPAKCKGFCKKSFVEQVVGKDSAKKQPYPPKKRQRNGCNPAPFCYNGRWISHAAGGRIFPPGQEEYKTL